jgi:hypothetical protein
MFAYVQNIGVTLYAPNELSMQTKRANLASESPASYLTDLERKCMVIKLSIQDGDYSLDDALQANQVTKADFEGFIAKHLVSDLKSTLAALNSTKLQMLISIDVIADVIKQLLGGVDKKLHVVEAHLKNLSRDIVEGTAVVQGSI